MTALTICFREADLGPSERAILRGFTWQVKPAESWLITGSNGSGKSAVAQALAGGLEVSSRDASNDGERPNLGDVALISFEQQRDLVFDERYHDDGEFVEGGVDPGTPARDFILRRKRGEKPVPATAELTRLARLLNVEAILDRGLKYLSTGEIRKVSLCRELLRRPPLLIFDEPYEGLDSATRVVLSEEIERLIRASLETGRAEPGAAKTQVLVITDRYEHVPAATTHVLHIEDRRVVFAGPRSEFEARGIPPELRGLAGAEAESLGRAVAETLHEGESARSDASKEPRSELLKLRNVTVSYSDRPVLQQLNLTIARGEHTLVRGPNGCGKTTLLNLINGDNPQVYANDVTICGMKRGSGESVWDVKKQLGQVSYALHVEYAYRCQANAIETVLSGFYDSIGLYREPGFAELRAAERWLDVVGMLPKRAEPFTELSYGEQRVVLILRAVVKQPPL